MDEVRILARLDRKKPNRIATSSAVSRSNRIDAAVWFLDTAARTNEHAYFLRIMAIPVVEQKLCTGCGECVEICEANAIRTVGEKARINYNLCYNTNGSNCRACVDVCPKGAIRLVD